MSLADTQEERREYRFHGLEGLRAVLAWWVVTAHLLQHSRVSPPMLPGPLDVLWVGILPVFGFMILSGFVISHLLTVKDEPYGGYIFRRFMRLFPVMALAVLVAFALNMAGLPRMWPDDHLAARLIAQLSLFHGLIPDTLLDNGATSFSGPGWSVSLEWQFYLLAPLIVGSVLRKWTYAAGISALSVGLMVVLHGGADILIEPVNWTYSKPSHLASALLFFVAGMWIYRAVIAARARRRLETATNTAVAMILLIVSAPLTAKPYDFLIPVFGLAVIWLVLAPGGLLARLFSARWMRWLGQISYSTYVLHIFVIYAVQQALLPYTGFGWALLGWMSAITIPLILTVSASSYLGIERPVMRWAARRAAAFRRG